MEGQRSQPDLDDGCAPSAEASGLATKYTKLASEYSKVRAQLGVLRKAVIDEQSKNAEVQEAVKAKDQALRKSEAEMDSLNFRNQQLAKRVQVLQDDLESLSHRAGPGGFKVKNHSANQQLNHQNQPHPQQQQHQHQGSNHQHHMSNAERVAASENFNSVISEELQQKIAENVRLHEALDGVEKRYEDRIDSLQARVHELESVAAKKARAERADDARLKEMLLGLKKENGELKSRIRELETDVVDRNDRITLLQVQLESTQSLGSFEDDLKSLDSTSLAVPAANTLQQLQPQMGHNKEQPQRQPNPPLTRMEARIQSIELLSQLGDSVQEVVAGLSDVHTYWEHRLKDTRSPNGNLPWTDSSTNLSKLLLQNVRYLKPIEQSFQDVLSNLLSSPSGGSKSPEPLFAPLTLVGHFKGFSAALADYVRFASEDVEPLLIVAIQQESNSSSCSPTQQAKNCQLQTTFRSIHRVLVRLSGHVANLCGESPADRVEQPLTSSPAKGSIGGSPAGGRSGPCAKSLDAVEALECVENIAAVLSDLQQQAMDLTSVYRVKADDEKDLPTASDRLIATNQCVMAALSSITAAFGRLSRFLSDKLPRITVLLKARFDPDDNGEQQQQLPQQQAEALPEIEVSSGQQNGSFKKDDCRSLEGNGSCLSSLSGINNSLGIVSGDRIQLELMKEGLASLQQEVDILRDRLKKAENQTELWKIEYQLHKMKLDKLKKQSTTGSNSASDQGNNSLENSDEEGSKSVFFKRIEELISDRVLADSKATHFYLECVALQKRIRARERAKAKAERDLREAEERIKGLREDAGVMNSNYEGQLSTMSEHVANMNDKLASQTDQINRLRYELNSKSGGESKRKW